MAGKGPEINWEDDDDSFGKTEAEAPPADFEAMLERAADDEPDIITGERCKGVISSIPKDGGISGDVLVDLGGKMSGVIDRAELFDENGKLTVKVGDTIEAFVLSRKGDEVQLSMKLSQALRSMEDLQSAFQKKLAVKGRVTKVNKGGFEVTILGKTAFCPVSQMDSRFVENTAEYLNKDFEFLIEKFDPKGRNIVVTRKALLAQQAEQRLKEIMAGLKPDTILQGTVKEVRDFGAFVDIGGVDGLVHVSELSYARVARASDAVTVGDKVRVKVLKIEQDAAPGPGGKPRPKISLSIKAAARDPWDDVEQEIATGKTYTGRVTKLMPFGAFVELKAGFEGLVHVSEMSWTKRIHHPSDVVKEGQTVTVVVKDIDRAQKRIALTMKQVEDDPWFDATAKYAAGKVLEGKVEKLKPFGAIVELGTAGLTGMIPIATLKKKFGEAYRQATTPGKALEVRVARLDTDERKILLTLTGIDDDGDGQEDYKEYLASEKAAQQAVAAEAAKSGAGGSGGLGSLGALLSEKLKQKGR